MDVGAAGGLDAIRAAALVEHYHKTMDLVTHHWERRSRQFVTLVAVLAGAALAFLRPLIAPALASIVLQNFPKLNQAMVENAAPVAADLLLAFLVISVFYLTASLVNRTSVINTYYGYLEALESEIRPALGIKPGQVAFTREGDFYRSVGSGISNLIARCYKWVLGTLLVFFFAARLVFDYAPDILMLPPWERGPVIAYVGKIFLWVIDVVVVIPTAWLFVRLAVMRPPRPEEVRANMQARG
jgi:hypothetical protein